MVTFGDPCVKTYSNTQNIIAFSSGDVQFHGIAQVGGIDLGIIGIMNDFGFKRQLQANADSVGAKSFALGGVSGSWGTWTPGIFGPRGVSPVEN